jgi:hypothetical protein
MTCIGCAYIVFVEHTNRGPYDKMFRINHFDDVVPSTTCWITDRSHFGFGFLFVLAPQVICGLFGILSSFWVAIAAESLGGKLEHHSQEVEFSTMQMSCFYSVYLQVLTWQNLVWMSSGNFHQATNAYDFEKGKEREVSWFAISNFHDHHVHTIVDSCDYLLPWRFLNLATRFERTSSSFSFL